MEPFWYQWNLMDIDNTKLKQVKKQDIEIEMLLSMCYCKTKKRMFKKIIHHSFPCPTKGFLKKIEVISI